MRQSLVIGNWKMHGSLAENAELLHDLLPRVAGLDRTAVSVCPPAPYLLDVSGKLAGSKVVLGAQNICAEALESGAYTGEVSAAMLADVGVRYVLVGHSERREYYRETDDVVAAKFVQAQAAGLLPVLCVGENLAQREAGTALECVAAQLAVVVARAGIRAFLKAVVAYEPVWAIGTGKTASPEQAQEVHAHLRQVLGSFDREVADRIQLLYGGSVKADNARDLFAMNDIDGALVGGASLKADEFIAICKAAE